MISEGISFDKSFKLYVLLSFSFVCVFILFNDQDGQKRKRCSRSGWYSWLLCCITTSWCVLSSFLSFILSFIHSYWLFQKNKKKRLGLGKRQSIKFLLSFSTGLMEVWKMEESTWMSLKNTLKGWVRVLIEMITLNKW